MRFVIELINRLVLVLTLFLVLTYTFSFSAQVQNTSVLSGFRKGIKIDKTIQIDDTPWLQPLSHSLRQFSDSSRERIEFWHIRTDDLAPVKLAAVKIGLGFGDVRVGRMGYLVEILPTGEVAPLWQASFWFRSGDKVFCRYGSRSGAWGTTLAVISPDREEG